ncbi:MAG TPA: Rap1a/Tai family immunity protein [Burkholderiales bacterium]|nr:Rap1a/Tai family immunity protein [Burkholderiales bacterium]
MFNRSLALAILMAASSAMAAEEAPGEKEFMHGYYYGFIEATIQPVYKKEVCPKDNVDDTIKKFTAYADANPTRLRLGPPLKLGEVLAAMKTLYPCSGKKEVSPH